MKKLLALGLCIILCVGMTACGAKSNLQDFYDTVSEVQGLLDIVADDIYTNWHDAIYEDEFDGDINTAILMAQIENSENLSQIDELDKGIADVFKKVKDGKEGDLAKEIMSAYSDYYEFVVNVSGSFKTFSAKKETLKKELASLLKDLSYEL